MEKAESRDKDPENVDPAMPISQCYAWSFGYGSQ